MRGEGEEGGSSSYSPGNTPYEIKMGVIVAVVLLGTCKRYGAKKILELFSCYSIG